MMARVNAAATHSVRSASSDAGEYHLLYTYLHDRFANRVVLTFGEIEDVIGFSLPERARLRLDWWDGTDPPSPRTAQASSWTLAGRTAGVNLVAQSVLFERPAEAHSRQVRRGI